MQTFQELRAADVQPQLDGAAVEEARLALLALLALDESTGWPARVGFYSDDSELCPSVCLHKRSSDSVIPAEEMFKAHC